MTSASALTIQSETNAIARPASVTTAQAMFDFRVKNGVSSVATIVPISQSSAVNGRSPSTPIQVGINGLSMVLTQSGNSDMKDSAPLKAARVAFTMVCSKTSQTRRQRDSFESLALFRYLLSHDDS